MDKVLEGIVNLIDLKHESSLIFKDCWEPCWNTISVHEPSPTIILMKGQRFFQIYLDLEMQQHFLAPLPEDPLQEISRDLNYYLYSWYISTFLSRSIDQAKH